MISKKFLTLVVSTLLTLLMVTSILLVGCAKPAPTTTTPAPTTPAPTTPKPTTPAPTTPTATTPAPTTPKPTTPAPTVAIRKTTISYGHYFAVDDFRDKTAKHYAEVVSQLSNGLITVKVYPAEQLVRGVEGFTGVASGIVDLYVQDASYFAGQVPLMDIFNLPLPPYDDETAAKIVHEAWGVIEPAFAEKGVKVLGVINSTGPGYCYFSKPVRTLEDLKGLKIRASGGLFETMMKKMGMSVVTMSAAEQYMGLQTKVVDGANTTFQSVISFKLYEVAPYWLNVDFGGAHPYFLMMNQNKWKGMNAAEQKVMADAQAQTETWMFNEFKTEIKTLGDGVAAKMKEVITPTKTELVRWYALKTDLIDGWKAKAGPSADAMLTIFNKYQ